jgi:hypothetical protein
VKALPSTKALLIRTVTLVIAPVASALHCHF